MNWTTTPATHRQHAEEMETTTPSLTATSSVKSLCKSSSDGLILTKRGSVSMIRNEVNAKYNASYNNSDNANKFKLLGRSLTLGQDIMIYIC